jgi:hypothetical protein
MRATLTLRRVLALRLAAGSLTACSHPQKTVTSSWDSKATVAHLDQREVTWMGWPGPARDHGTFLRVVSHGCALRPLAACALHGTRRTGGVRQRTLLDEKC